MPNWCTNRLTITGEEHVRMAELWRAGQRPVDGDSGASAYSCDELAELQKCADKQAWMKHTVRRRMRRTGGG